MPLNRDQNEKAFLETLYQAVCCSMQYGAEDTPVLLFRAPYKFAFTLHYCTYLGSTYIYKVTVTFRDLLCLTTFIGTVAFRH